MPLPKKLVPFSIHATWSRVFAGSLILAVSNTSAPLHTTVGATTLLSVGQGKVQLFITMLRLVLGLLQPLAFC